jgi:hypothetical protein
MIFNSSMLVSIHEKIPLIGKTLPERYKERADMRVLETFMYWVVMLLGTTTQGSALRKSDMDTSPLLSELSNIVGNLSSLSPSGAAGPEL